MSAPLRPAARTRTSSSPRLGLGIGVLLDARSRRRGWSRRAWRRSYAPGLESRRVQGRLNDRVHGVRPRIRVHTCDNGVVSPPRVPARAPSGSLTCRIFRRCGGNRGSAFEAAALRRSGVWRGEGVPPGDGRPVLLIPGFMAGDGSLATMTEWLRANGYRTRRAGIRANVGCSEAACARLEARLEALRRGRRAARSRSSARAAAASSPARSPLKRPELVAGIVTLGSPDRLAAAHAPARARARSGGRRARLRPRARAVQPDVPARRLLRGLPRRARGAVPGRRPLTCALLAHRRHRRLARLLRSQATEWSRSALALRHGGQRGRLPGGRPRAGVPALAPARRTSTLGGVTGSRSLGGCHCRSTPTSCPGSRRGPTSTRPTGPPPRRCRGALSRPGRAQADRARLRARAARGLRSAPRCGWARSSCPHIWVLHRQVFNVLDLEPSARPLPDAVPDRQRVDVRLRASRSWCSTPSWSGCSTTTGRRAVLAHEAAHVHADHVLYQTALPILLRLGTRGCRARRAAAAGRSGTRCSSGSARPSCPATARRRSSRATRWRSAAR